ncbi:MAG TPA: SDR family oxidoreductase [Tepidisphaeraceae bacterium]|nr:SDR family oxidoreductase [Tepidisphaeraceae bacterium]
MATKTSLLALGAAMLGAYGAARVTARRQRRVSFRGKVVVITGGSRGLGLLLARRFGAEGAKVVIAARELDELIRAREELRLRGVDCASFQCNVQFRADVESLVRSATETYGGIDVWVNNAGVIQVAPLELMQTRDYQEAMDIHFWGPLHAMMAVRPVMRGRGGGRIVNISSIGGKVAVPHLAPYCASKFALAGLSQASAIELRQDNIYVTSVYPNLIRTGSPRNALFKGRNEREYTWFTLGDSLPGVSQNADRAAERIIEACRHGEPELITGLPAALAARFHALLPWLSIEAAALTNRVALPSAGGIGAQRARGRDSETAVTRSPLTALTRAAARANNELGAQQA